MLSGLPRWLWGIMAFVLGAACALAIVGVIAYASGLKTEKENDEKVISYYLAARTYYISENHAPPSVDLLRQLIDKQNKPNGEFWDGLGTGLIQYFPLDRDRWVIVSLGTNRGVVAAERVKTESGYRMRLFVVGPHPHKIDREE